MPASELQLELELELDAVLGTQRLDSDHLNLYQITLWAYGTVRIILSTLMKYKRLCGWN